VPASLGQLEVEAAREYYKIEFVKRFVKSGRVLDIGAGYGRFVYLAHKAGYEVDAIEVNSKCGEFISNVIGTRTIVHAQPEVALAGLEPYDVITFWHVIEHLTDPWAALKAAVQKLRRGGWLIVAMPNPESLQFRVFRQYWAHLDAPRHLQLVPAHLLTRELTSDGKMQFVEATTADQGSLDYNYLGWEWSMRNAIQLRGVWRIGRVLARVLGRFEQVGMRGSCYTAVFRRG
jgi:2-polyprenyl-3-methyl-5-hydroxy-6-metoxy-1,4-benzoquinol methylase